MKPEYIQAKSILSKLKDAPDPFFGITYNINLYRGCQHGCIYCDSRSDVYGLQNLAHIRIKENALTLLEQNLKKKIKKGTIGTGSMNDPYMPIEKKQENTRKALQLIAKYKYPAHIITKSTLVTRDIDLLQSIQTIYSAVSFTITTPYDSLSQNIEPYAPASSERLKALYQIAKSNLYTGVLIMPTLPYLTDSKKALGELIQKCTDNGAQYVLFMPGMTLRKGQTEYYYRELDNLWPGLSRKYQDKFMNNYQCNADNDKELWNTYLNNCQKFTIPIKMKFFSENLPVQGSLF